MRFFAVAFLLLIAAGPACAQATIETDHFRMGVREHLLPGGNTVTVLQPTAEGHQPVLDISPRGPGSVNNVWVDLCNTDMLAATAADPLFPSSCARFWYTRNAIKIGGAHRLEPIVPVVIFAGTNTLGTFKMSNGQTGTPQLIVGPFDSLAVSGQIAEMRREMARMAQALATAQARVLALERRLPR